MPNLKEIKTRIDSVKKTRKITSAMKLVAAAKLRGATDRADAAKPFKAKVVEVLGRVAAKAGDSAGHPLLTKPAETRKVKVVVLTSDRGLCGGFNNTLLRRMIPWLETLDASVDLVVYGRKGRDFLRSARQEVADARIDYADDDVGKLVRPLGEELVADFVDGEYDAVYLAYNHFVNATAQEPTFSQVLPIAMEDSVEDAAGASEFLYEPGPAALLDQLLPLYLKTQLQQAFLETVAGEFAARMVAMDNATNNASDLIDNLSLVYNRARQAAITTEITEIVSGAEAL